MFNQLTPTDYLTFGLLIVTGVYVWLTYQISSSNKRTVDAINRQIEAQTRPILTVNIGIRSRVLTYISIRNCGSSVAEQVKLRIDRAFFQFAELSAERDISQFHIFNDTIATFAPGDTYEIDLAQGFNINKEVNGANITPDNFKLTAEYWFGEKQYREEFDIDLKPYFSTRAPYTIQEEIAELRKLLEKRAVL